MSELFANEIVALARESHDLAFCDRFAQLLA